MKKFQFFILVLLEAVCNIAFGQYNLVPNHSFEDSVQCPKYLNNPLPKPWYIPSNYSVGAFAHACALDSVTGVPYNNVCGYKNYQPARTGDGYALILNYSSGSSFRSYIQVKLKDSLRQGRCYQCTFYVNQPNFSMKASNNIAMLLTETKIYSDTIANPTGLRLIPANPQVFNHGNPTITDTMGWVKVSSIYTATGRESFLTIGNFKNDAQTQTAVVNPAAMGCNNSIYYYVEDVSITPLDSIPLQADAGIDQTMAPGDSVYIGSYTNGLTNVVWYNSTGGIITTGIPGMYVKPTASTFYVIEQTVCGQYSRDTVYVNVGVVPLIFLSYELGVKNGGVVNEWTTANEVNVSHFNIQRSIDGVEFNTIQQTTARNKDYNEYSFTDVQPLNGTSYYRIEAVDKDGKRTYSSIQSIKLTTHDSPFTIYPNPAKDVVNIFCDNIRQISITDLTGRRLLEKNYNNSNNVQLHIDGLPKGVYVLKVVDVKGNIQTQKIIVQ